MKFYFPVFLKKKLSVNLVEERIDLFFLVEQAYCYQGENLLAQDKCGEAVRGLQEGVKCK